MTACSLPGSSSVMDSSSPPLAPRWLRQTLGIAAVYNVVWGSLAVLMPLAFFRLFGMAPPNYPQLWQCIGMIVGVYGVGYAIAALNPYRHWPVVLVGLMGKIFGPIGFAFALYQGTFPPAFGINILFNDLIWWIPFYLVLQGTYHHWLHETGHATIPPEQALQLVRTQQGVTLDALSRQKPLLLVFLRHAGCTFCRETLADLALASAHLEQAGLQPVLIHMGSPAQGEAIATHYGLKVVSLVSNPDRSLYLAAGLRRARLSQIFGWNVFVRGYLAGIRDGHGVGALQGDGFQLSGYAVIRDGLWVMSHPHADAAERSPFITLAQEFGQETVS